MKEKIEVVKEFRGGRPVADIAQHFGIGKTQVYRIFKNKDELEKKQSPIILQSSYYQRKVP